jgi:uncharacterized membrane protein YkvA (DUF1232 family)
MIRGLVEQIFLSFRLMVDPRVPILAKLIALIPIVYVISPIDILPDFIPVLGQLDDISVILLGMRLFESLVPGEIVSQHRAEISARGAKSLDVIESVENRVRGAAQNRIEQGKRGE